MPQSAILIAGFSHITCFGIRLRSSDGSPTLARLTDTAPHEVYGLETKWPREPAFVEQIAQFGADKHVVLSWSGNEHITHFLFEAERPFDFVSSRFPNLTLQRDADILPEALVQTAFDDYEKRMHRTVEQLKSRVYKLWLIGPPPPKRDGEVLKSHLRKEVRLLEEFRHRGMDPDNMKVAPPILRLKLWGLLWQRLDAVAKGNQVSAITPPTDATDELGFLLPEYSAADVAHGNLLFGRAYLKKVLATVYSE
jgi:hypothetical protein